jgi:hypothetical protein
MLGKKLKWWEKCYLIILSIHILKLEISGCDTDRNYELVPESEGEPVEVEVNVVEVQQDPDQSSEDLASDLASEGKPRSITYFC